MKEVENMNQEMTELEQVIKECSQAQFECDKRVKELEKEMNEFSGNREGKLKKLEVWAHMCKVCHDM